MKLTTVTNVSLDGVTQGHRRIDAGTRREAGAPDKEGSGGFERFGWAPPLLDDQASTFIGQSLRAYVVPILPDGGIDMGSPAAARSSASTISPAAG